jgi:prepilin-type processing-associated H-X9-DG protein
MGVESRSIAYSDFDFARIFVDDPHNGDRNKGVLALDHSGRPAVYLFFDGRNPCVMLSQHSLPDILAHWTPSKVEGGVYSFSFFCYSASDRTWKPVQVDLQFHDNYCDRFRVVSDETKIQNWLSAEVMPMQGYGKNVKRDIFFGLIEGPRDTTDCGILLIPEKYWKAVKNGRCPLTFSN